MDSLHYSEEPEGIQAPWQQAVSGRAICSINWCCESSSAAFCTERPSAAWAQDKDWDTRGLLGADSVF